MIDTSKAIIVSALILAFSMLFLFRYDATPIGDTNYMLVLDRWTGGLEACFYNGCRPAEEQ